MAFDLNNLITGVLGTINTIVASKKPAPTSSIDPNMAAAVNALLQQQNNKADVEQGFLGLSINAILFIIAAIVGVVLIARRN